MGLIVEAKFEDIVPCEDHRLRKSSIRALIALHEKGEPSLPVPVREHKGRYFQLDGRHRLVLARVLGANDISLYVAQNPEDSITNEAHPTIDPSYIDENNTNIRRRFLYTAQDAERVMELGHGSNYAEFVAILQQRHPQFNSYDRLKEHVKRVGLLQQLTPTYSR